MIVLYMIGVAIAWLVQPKEEQGTGHRVASRNLKLVFAAVALDQARRRKDRTVGAFPRPCRREE
jgi:hypothetical protein